MKKKTELTSKFGLKVKMERTKRGLTQEQLAERANLNHKSICAIEKGLTTPSIETVNDIAKAFGITLLELMDVDNFN